MSQAVRTGDIMSQAVPTGDVMSQAVHTGDVMSQAVRTPRPGGWLAGVRAAVGECGSRRAGVWSPVLWP